MGGWWVEEAWNHPAGPIVLGSWVFWVIFSIVLHELAHGWAAIHEGDDVPIQSGHMTWNPVVHMGLFSLIAFLLVGIAWGAMPVNPHNFRSRYGEAKVAAAGPAMNLLLAIAAMIMLVLWVAFAGSVGDPVRTNVEIFARTGAWLNIVLMLFNLVPVPPLDGSRIIADFFPAYGRLWQSEQGAIIVLVAFLLAFKFLGAVLFGVAIITVEIVEGIFVSLLGGNTP